MPSTATDYPDTTNRPPPQYINSNGSLISPIGNVPGARQSKSYRNARQTALAVQDFLPAIIKAINEQQISNAPATAQSQLDILRTLGPQYTDIISALNQQGQGAQALTDLGILKGTGKDVTAQTLELQKLADPEFFALREALGAGAGKLLGAIDPTKLSEAEIANIERTNNRNNINQGTAGTGSNLAAIKNAMVFGDKLQAKQNSFTQTLTNIGNLAPNLKSGAFNYAAATGQAGAGAGQQELGGNFNTGQTQTSNIASNLLGQSGAINMNERNIQANKIPNYERVLSALPDYS